MSIKLNALSDYYRLISFDPGKTTGVSLFKIENGRVVEVINGSHQGFDIIDLLKINNKDVILYENYFLPYGKQGIQHKFNCSGVEFIGAIKYACMLASIEPFVQQPELKDFMKKKYRKEVAQLRYSIHNLEAYLHGLYFLYSKFGYPIREVFEYSKGRTV